MYRNALLTDERGLVLFDRHKSVPLNLLTDQITFFHKVLQIVVDGTSQRSTSVRGPFCTQHTLPADPSNGPVSVVSPLLSVVHSPFRDIPLLGTPGTRSFRLDVSGLC